MPRSPFRRAARRLAAFGLGAALLAPAGWAAPLAPKAVVAPAEVPLDLDVTLETRAGQTLEGRVLRVEDDGLVLEAAGASRTIPLADLLLLGVRRPPTGTAQPAGAEPADGPSDILFLRRPGAGSADRLVGRLLGGDQYGVRFALDDGTPVSVPFECIERLLPRADLPIDRLALLEGGGADDRVWQRRADGGFDSLNGVLERVDPATLVFDGALGSLSFALDEVAAVVLAPVGEPPAAPSGRPVVVRLAGGSRLEAGLLELDGERVVLATAFAERLSLPLAALAGLVVRGEGVVLLADLAPVEVRESPSIGRPEDFLFPWRTDLSVTGRLLSVGGVPRATGLGVHANADLVFALPARTERLRVTAGLVDEVLELPAAGSVSFEILVDGESRASSGVQREGQAPVVLRVDGLSGHERVELRVRDGGDDDAGDRAAWVDGVLLLGDG